MNVMIAGIFGGWEIVLILAVVLLLFGAKKLPELAKGLGTGIKEFKKATREVTDEIQNAGTETPPPAPKAPADTTAQTQSQPATPQTPPQTKVI
ncbi:MAG: twin-arginine translocase TatA/TatE family subunit [Verrucomicrobiota bacterium]|jgi:sec-independent protein translocase protein TatA